jgi:hypothetical protein
MAAERVGMNFRKEIAQLLGQLKPTPSAEWVILETDRILRQFKEPGRFAAKS